MLPLPVSRAARAARAALEGGVLGALPGVIGTIQATEALKLVLGAGSTLVGRLLLYDAWTMKFRELKLRDPACPICGDHPLDQGIDRLRGILRRASGADGRCCRSLGS